MTLIEKLRQETRPAHEELDAAMTPFIHNIRSEEDYIKLLVAFYGFFKPVYEKIEKHLDTSLLPDYSERRKPDDILSNLKTFRFQQGVVPSAENLPRIQNNAAAFGALYVMEGSTLGGLMIRKMIAGQTNLPDEQLSFFSGYGRQTREKWNAFLSALNNATMNPEEDREAVSAAAETFTFFRQWLHKVYFDV